LIRSADGSHADAATWNRCRNGQGFGVTDEGESPAGRYLTRRDGKDARGIPAPSGVYFCQLVGKGYLKTRAMVLQR
ncbi:MAG: hypothetical protein AABZ61_00080, partial [Bacteroidota bacterium]